MNSETDPNSGDGQANPLILLGDDEAALITGLSETLAHYGFAVEQAGSWVALLERLRLAAPDLLIVETRLGEVDLVGRFAELRDLTKAPVIFLTRNHADADRILALEQGAAEVLRKPVSGREIIARIRALLPRGVVSARPNVPLQARRLAGGESRRHAPDPAPAGEAPGTGQAARPWPQPQLSCGARSWTRRAFSSACL